MAFSVSVADSQINDAAIIEIVQSPPAVSGFPPGGARIPIQFPPHIVDDTKSANWVEEGVASYEPITIWHGALARKIAVELTYIVTGGQFTTVTIPQIAQNFKAYFYRSINSTRAPIVKMTIYNHMTVPNSTWRLLDVNISHGETIINDGSGIFPLMTKIKVNAALMTNITNKMNVKGLPEKPEIGWY